MCYGIYLEQEKDGVAAQKGFDSPLPNTYLCGICRLKYKAYRKMLQLFDLNMELEMEVCESCLTSADQVHVKDAVKAQNSGIPAEVVDSYMDKLITMYREPQHFRT